MKDVKKSVYKIIIAFLIFWLLDFTFHHLGVGETNFYSASKFFNSILFALIWFFIFNKKSHLGKFLFSFVFGTWVSFYYLIASYSGLVQLLGIYARYTPPPFVIFGLYLSPVLWWSFHALTFYLGLELADFIIKTKKQ